MRAETCMLAPTMWRW